jgi:hypothetical protein
MRGAQRIAKAESREQKAAGLLFVSSKRPDENHPWFSKAVGSRQ